MALEAMKEMFFPKTDTQINHTEREKIYKTAKTIKLIAIIAMVSSAVFILFSFAMINAPLTLLTLGAAAAVGVFAYDSFSMAKNAEILKKSELKKVFANTPDWTDPKNVQDYILEDTLVLKHIWKYD